MNKIKIVLSEVFLDDDIFPGYELIDVGKSNLFQKNNDINIFFDIKRLIEECNKLISKNQKPLVILVNSKVDNEAIYDKIFNMNIPLSLSLIMEEFREDKRFEKIYTVDENLLVKIHI
jgi:hypothetical protein